MKEAATRAVIPGVAVRQRWQDAAGCVRILAVAEGCVMFRREGEKPDALAVTEFYQQFRPAPPSSGARTNERTL